MSDRRLGRICIPRDALKDYVWDVWQSLALMPLHVETDLINDYVLITAVSNQFDEVAEGAKTPNYCVIMERLENGEIRFLRVEKGEL